jgi:hypothetical protein
MTATFRAFRAGCAAVAILTGLAIVPVRAQNATYTFDVVLPMTG